MSGIFFKKLAFLLISASIITACSKPAAPPPDMVQVPGGEFTMGSDDVDREAKAMQYGSTKPWYVNENPARKVNLKPYYIDKYEVTNAKYKEFVDATGRKAPAGWAAGFPQDQADHPVTHVTWHDAEAFCKWKKMRLPSEAEWEKAARGTDARTFPWGNDFDHKKVNTMGEYGGTVRVGLLQDGASPFGAYEMAGNVQEWVQDWYQPYPGNTFKDPDYGEQFKVVRGGGWGGMGHYTLQVYVRTAFRNMAKPDTYYNDVGFRCAWSE